MEIKISRFAVLAVAAGIMMPAMSFGLEIPGTSPLMPMNPEDTVAERGSPAQITFYCCDRHDGVRCSVSTPGPVGAPCFCPGSEDTGKLCTSPENRVPKQ